jgi:S1-C subfamily serine protease
MDENSQLERRVLLSAGASATLALLGGCSDSSISDEEQESTPQPEVENNSSYTNVYEQTVNSVVLIRTNSGQGTGFMYSNSHIVTNAHVVEEATSAEIRFSRGEWTTADLIGIDPHSDLAVLEVEDTPPDATPLRFSETAATTGQRVLAIGNPYNLDGSMSTGIVSGTNRSVTAPTGFKIPDAIQTDAAVNPGNSGGPLLSADGEVVGVVNARGGDNIGFGISAALTQRVVDTIIEEGEYTHSYLGASFDPVTPSVAEANNLENPTGLLLIQLDKDGPADSALQPSTDTEIVSGKRVATGGDVVRAIDNTELKTAEDLSSYLALNTRPGDRVNIDLLRDGEQRAVRIKLDERPTRAV